MVDFHERGVDMEFTLDWNIFQKFLNKPMQRESDFGRR